MSTTSELRPVTELRRRMIADLQLRGVSERTQEMYVRAVRQLAEHYHKSPDKITEEELREYFLYIKNVKKWSRAGMTIALCGIKFFYENTLKLPWTTLTFVRPPQEKKLPTILNRDEVRLILGKVRLLPYLVCLRTIYSCGLRLKEGTHPFDSAQDRLKVADIDTQRHLIHIHHAKGGKACPELVEGIATCRCRNQPWSGSVSIGKRIVIPCGFFPRRDGAAFIVPLPLNPCLMAMSKTPFAPH